MEPTNCSAGLRDGSSTMVESMSVIGDVSIIPLSAMNMLVSIPLMLLMLNLRRANKGQKDTKSTVAKRITGVERLCGGVVADTFLSGR